jgi:hypothetical protein
MAKFELGEKASKEEAEKALRKHAAGVWDGRFDVKFESDDGGNHIVLYLEVEDVSQRIEQFAMDALWVVKWMGWRFLIIKCPDGYIDYILNSTASDDW